MQILPIIDQGDGIRRIDVDGVAYFKLGDFSNMLNWYFGKQLMQQFREAYPGVPFLNLQKKDGLPPGNSFGWFCPDAAYHLLMRYCEDLGNVNRARRYFHAVCNSKGGKASAAKKAVAPIVTPVIAAVVAPIIVPKPVRVVVTNDNWFDSFGRTYRGHQVIIQNINTPIKAIVGPDNWLSVTDMMAAVGRKGWRVRETISATFPSDILESRLQDEKRAWVFIRAKRAGDFIKVVRERTKQDADRDKALEIMSKTLVA